MERPDDTISDNIEVVPVVVVSQTFPARPSSIPDIRDFVRKCLAQSPLSEQDTREVGETVSRALLEAAGPTGAISVSFRIFPDHVEVDVLKSGAQIGAAAGLDALTSLMRAHDAAGAARQASVAGNQAAEDPAGNAARQVAAGRGRGVVRRLDGGRAPPGGPDHGGRRAPARRVGEDREPLGRRRHRAPAA